MATLIKSRQLNRLRNLLCSCQRKWAFLPNWLKCALPDELVQTTIATRRLRPVVVQIPWWHFLANLFANSLHSAFLVHHLDGSSFMKLLSSKWSIRLELWPNSQQLFYGEIHLCNLLWIQNYLGISNSCSDYSNLLAMCAPLHWRQWIRGVTRKLIVVPV